MSNPEQGEGYKSEEEAAAAHGFEGSLSGSRTDGEQDSWPGAEDPNDWLHGRSDAEIAASLASGLLKAERVDVSRAERDDQGLPRRDNPVRTEESEQVRRYYDSLSPEKKALVDNALAELRG